MLTRFQHDCVRDSSIISRHVAISNLLPSLMAESNCEDQSQKKDDVVASKECVKRVAAAHSAHTQTNKEA